MMCFVVVMVFVNFGYFIFDYIVYEELFFIFCGFIFIFILLGLEDGYIVSVQMFEIEIVGCGLSVVLVSNFCNFMGYFVDGQLFLDWIDVG